MEIFPAIDLRGGKVVRLTQGDYQQMVVYADNPTKVAKAFQETGASNLHVVDLDGAKEGTLCNFETIEHIVQNTSLFVQVGGGIRDEKRIQKYIQAGVKRVILGTAALENRAFVKEMVSVYGEKIAVGVDAKDGKVAVKGWLEVSDTDSVAFCKELDAIGVKTIIYTDISKDGQMAGTNIQIYQTLQKEVGCDIVASGGISYEDEINKLAQMHVYGAILGKALYTKNLDLARCIQLAKERC